MTDTITPTMTADRIRTMYTENPAVRKMHALVIGEKGAGKTSLIATCPTPILVHSFDPGGTEVLVDAIEEGKVLVDTRFEVDDIRNPSAYITWETEFNSLGRSGFFSSIGTYVLDSLTTFCDCMLSQVMKKEGRIPPGMNSKTDEARHMLRIQDWGTIGRQFENIARSLGSLPCHTLVMGHLGKERNEITGDIINRLLLPGKSSDKFPTYLHELYTLLIKDGKRKLLTQNDGKYIGTTRMGRNGRFELYEEPNIRRLLEKAGYPCGDRETI